MVLLLLVVHIPWLSLDCRVRGGGCACGGRPAALAAPSTNPAGVLRAAVCVDECPCTAPDAARTTRIAAERQIFSSKGGYDPVWMLRPAPGARRCISSSSSRRRAASPSPALRLRRDRSARGPPRRPIRPALPVHGGRLRHRATNPTRALRARAGGVARAHLVGLVAQIVEVRHWKPRAFNVLTQLKRDSPYL